MKKSKYIYRETDIYINKYVYIYMYAWNTFVRINIARLRILEVNTQSIQKTIEKIYSVTFSYFDVCKLHVCYIIYIFIYIYVRESVCVCVSQQSDKQSSTVSSTHTQHTQFCSTYVFISLLKYNNLNIHAHSSSLVVVNQLKNTTSMRSEIKFEICSKSKANNKMKFKHRKEEEEEEKSEQSIRLSKQTNRDCKFFKNLLRNCRQNSEK